MKKKKIIGIAISSILVILILGLSFVGNYFYNLALNPDTPKDIVLEHQKRLKQQVDKC